MTNHIHELAQQLLRDGYVDNEADACLAAVLILRATEAMAIPRNSGRGDPSRPESGGRS